jgi:hypothetical protein
MSITGMLSNAGAINIPSVEIKSIKTGTASNGYGLTINSLEWEVGDLILVAQFNGSYTNFTGNMDITAPAGVFTTIITRYVNDTYDSNFKLYGWIATSDGDTNNNSMTFSGSGYGGDAQGVIVYTIKAGTWDGTLPTTSNGGVIKDYGLINGDDANWAGVGGLSETDQYSLHILFHGVSHRQNTRYGTDPGDLDYFKSISRADTYDFTFSTGYKRVNTSWTPATWYVNGHGTYSSQTLTAIRLGV